jgi:hypothetical protein
MPSYKKIHKLLDSILSGGVDNAPLSTDEIETINMLIDLANRTDNDEVRDLLFDAVIITEKKLAWRVRHSHDLSIDRFKVWFTSALFIAAIAAIKAMSATSIPYTQVFFLFLCVTLVLLAVTVLISRERLWEDYPTHR